MEKIACKSQNGFKKAASTMIGLTSFLGNTKLGNPVCIRPSAVDKTRARTMQHLLTNKSHLNHLSYRNSASISKGKRGVNCTLYRDVFKLKANVYAGHRCDSRKCPSKGKPLPEAFKEKPKKKTKINKKSNPLKRSIAPPQDFTLPTKKMNDNVTPNKNHATISMTPSQNNSKTLDMESQIQENLARDRQFQESMGQKLSLISNCTGPLSNFVYPSETVRDDLRCAVGADSWKYGVVCLTKGAYDEAYDVLEELTKDGQRIPFQVTVISDGKELTEVNVRSDNLEWNT